MNLRRNSAKRAGERRRTLSAKLFWRVFGVAVLLGLLVYIASALRLAADHREAGVTLGEQLANAILAPATDAAWSINASLAGQTLRGVLELDAVAGGSVVLEDGEVLSEITPAANKRLPWYMRWICENVFADAAQVERNLVYRDGQGVEVPVGQLTLMLDTSALSRALVDALWLQLLETALLIAIVVGVLTLTIHALLTRPILRFAQAVDDIDPQDPASVNLVAPSGHADDELGVLSRRLNAVLNRLGDAQRDLRNMATRDSLTALPNRTLIMEELQEEVQRSRRTGAMFALFYMDLDRFKDVNDSLGHEVGDMLIARVAEALTSVVGVEGWIGRLGGDEFIVIQHDIVDISQCVDLAQRIISYVHQPISIENHALRPSLSIGIAVFPDDGHDGAVLLRQADTAMYSAKAKGSNEWAFFEKRMTTNAIARLNLESSLRAAIDAGDFEVHLQPKQRLSDGAIYGAECLVRWRRHDRLVPPGEFIPLAEETGLIKDLGDWVMEETCRYLSEWQGRYPGLVLSVNVASLQLADPQFANRIRQILLRYAVDPTLLEVEITETSLMRNVAQTTQTVTAIRNLGVSVSVDDFGTGYSSLAYLNQLSLDTIKIDRSFVRNIPRDVVLAKSIVVLARQLGLKTVAEGVETEAQRTWLADAGCDAFQGFLLAPPMPGDDFERFLRDNA